MHDETLLIQGGYEGGSTRAVAVPIYQTIAHDFIDADHAAGIFDMKIPGFHYNRINNPTNQVLERRLMGLEHGTAVLTLASGMAAVSYSILNVTHAGSNVVTAPQLYGGIYTYFAHVLPTFGVQARFAADDTSESIGKLIDDKTAAVFCETVGNPAGNVVDLAAVADVAHRAGVPLIVDNTVPTPLMLKPAEHGADVIIHSLTKFLGGHGTTMGGAIIDAGTFDWAAQGDRFPMFNRPDPAYHNATFSTEFPTTAFAIRARSVYMRNTGAVLSPFNAFQILQGMETLPLRLDRHESNARAVAAALKDDPRVAWVSFAGFPEHPYYDLAQRYLKGRVPSIITFGPRGGYDAAIAFFNATKLFRRLVNLGDAKSLVTHSASTTHRQLSPTELEDVGIRPDTVRLSVGLEHIDDLLEDLDQALAAATR